jgi:hypothetical protein
MCDHIEATVEELENKGVEVARPISDEGSGLITSLKLPDGGKLGLYEPRHATADALPPGPRSEAPAANECFYRQRTSEVPDSAGGRYRRRPDRCPGELAGVAGLVRASDSKCRGGCGDGRGLGRKGSPLVGGGPFASPLSTSSPVGESLSTRRESRLDIFCPALASKATTNLHPGGLTPEPKHLDD